MAVGGSQQKKAAVKFSVVAERFGMAILSAGGAHGIIEREGEMAVMCTCWQPASVVRTFEAAHLNSDRWQAWGEGNSGQLGLGAFENYEAPQTLTTMPGVVLGAAGGFHTLAVTQGLADDEPVYEVRVQSCITCTPH